MDNSSSSSSTSCSRHLVSYRAALAMNNLGVSMLEQGHQRKEAYATFKAALSNVRQNFSSSVYHNETEPSPVSHSEPHGLRILTQVPGPVRSISGSPIMSSSCCGKLKASATGTIIILPRDQSICPLHYHVAHDLLMEDPIYTFYQDRVLGDAMMMDRDIVSFPVRIESEDGSLELNDGQLKAVIAVLLYNIGLTRHLLLASMPPQGDTPLAGSRQLFALAPLKLASATLNSMLLDYHNFHHDHATAEKLATGDFLPMISMIHGPGPFIGVFQLQALVLQAKISLYQRLDWPAERHSARSRLAALKHLLQSRMVNMWVDKMFRPKSAGAA